MQVFIVGAGKLASELLAQLSPGAAFDVLPWSKLAAGKAPAIVVHAGSGRELGEVLAFCQATGSVLVELATGSAMETSVPSFPVVLCPNTNILMLKFLSMLERSGHLFAGSPISVTESHQAGKMSTPGTAMAIARSLGVCADEVVSVRDPREQEAALRIPPEHLDRHAVHVVSVQEGSCSISMETRVYGSSPYADGVARIVAAAHAQPLEKRIYPIREFVERGWL
jgi:4-hydroxy-tetrahydrodipicolinate reductase